MKLIPAPLQLYVGLVLLFTFIFRWSLDYAMANDAVVMILVICGLYGLANMAAGYFTGRANGARQVLYDIGLRWNIGTFLGFGIASAIWLFLIKNASDEESAIFLVTMFYWIIGLAIHGIVFLILNRRRSIRGIQKDKVFD